ncbi:hypothetical protein A2U01_0077343, partial [Trifolium medium]|nr:hypothetical protein [Trifolium medium]
RTLPKGPTQTVLSTVQGGHYDGKAINNIVGGIAAGADACQREGHDMQAQDLTVVDHTIESDAILNVHVNKGKRPKRKLLKGGDTRLPSAAKDD